MTRDDLETGLRCLAERLDELRLLDPDLRITWTAQPDLPLAIIEIGGIEVLIDPLHLIQRISPSQSQPGHDGPTGAAPFRGE